MTLKEYIDNDPDGLGLAALVAVGNDEGVASLINSPSFDLVGNYVDRDTFEAYVIGNAISAAAKIASEDPATPTPVKIACVALDDVLRSNRFPEIRLQSCDAIMTALVSAGIATQTHVDELHAISRPVYKTYAQKHGLGVVDSFTVSAAINRPPVPSGQVGHGPGIYDTDDEWEAAKAAEAAAHAQAREEGGN